MNIPAIFKNRTFQVVAGIAAFALVFPQLVGWAIGKVVFWGLVAGAGYMLYKHVYKPWKSQKQYSSVTKNPHAYDSKAVHKQLNKAFKNFKK